MQVPWAQSLAMLREKRKVGPKTEPRSRGGEGEGVASLQLSDFLNSHFGPGLSALQATSVLWTSQDDQGAAKSTDI